MVIAWKYGVSETVDAYVLVFYLLNWPIVVWFSILTVALVPLVARLRVNSPQEIQQFRNEVFGFSLIVGTIVSVSYYFLLPFLLKMGWVGLSTGTLDHATDFATGLAPIAIIGIVISLFSAWMLAYEHHRNTLFEGIPALVILLILLLPITWIAEPLTLGTVVGFVFHLIALSTVLKRQGLLQLPKFNFQSPVWGDFLKAIGILAISQALMSLSTIIDNFTASHLGAGAISTLNYSNRIITLLLSLGALAISRAILPVFSDMHAKEEKNLRKTAYQWSGVMFLLGIVVLIVSWYLSTSIISIVFERGEFSATDTQNVSEIFRIALLQVPFYYSGLVLVQLLASHRQYNVIAFFAITNVIVKLIGNFVFPDIMGVPGIALSTCIMYVWSTICLFLQRFV